MSAFEFVPRAVLRPTSVESYGSDVVPRRSRIVKAGDLVRRSRQLRPSIGEVEPEAVRIAIRPIPGDHLSAIRPRPRPSGYYIAITHSGVTMSAVSRRGGSR
jgi:glycine/D-amino acid oxidase-like deaminating enzyme